VLHVWTELASGLQGCSIIWGPRGRCEAAANVLRSGRGRVAIADHDRITIIEFDLSALSSR
jgi:hypothetical protein